MTFHSGFRRAAISLAFVMTASTVNGQVISTRPFRSIFKTTKDPALSRDKVDVVVFFAGGHDQAETEGGIGALGQALDPAFSTASYGSLFVSGGYTHKGRKTTFSASGSTSTRFYTGSQGLEPARIAGGATFSGEAGRRGQFRLDQSATYSPYYTFSLTPDFLAEIATDLGDTATPVFDPDTDLRATKRSTYAYDTRGSYTHQTGRRSRVTARYELRYVDSAAPAADLIAHRVGGRYTHNVGRHLAVYGGYGVRLSRYLGSPFDAPVTHDLDGGVSYSRALFSAKTRVAFSVGSSVISTGDSNQFRINGNALVFHVISRGWSTAAYYNRGNDVYYGFAAPFVTFTDSVGGILNGRLFGPVQMAAIGSYTHGSYTVLLQQNVVNSAAGVLRVHVPVMWLLSTYAEAYYSEYRFERRIGLLPGVPTETTRYGVRAGLTFWVPVLR